MQHKIPALPCCVASFRWPFLCKAHALSWIRHHAGPLPAAVWKKDGWPALHPSTHGGNLLVCSHSICPGWVFVTQIHLWETCTPSEHYIKCKDFHLEGWIGTYNSNPSPSDAMTVSAENTHFACIFLFSQQFAAFGTFWVSTQWCIAPSQYQLVGV